MPRVTIPFKQMLRQPGGGMQDRLSAHALEMTEAALAKNCQVTEGILTKLPGWQRLAGLTPTGYSITCDGTNSMGVSFPDHADYDFGKRFTIDVTVKVTTLPGAGLVRPIYWRADSSNNRITVLEVDENGAFKFTHRDAAGTEKTLTTPHVTLAGETHHIRVSRFFGQLRIWFDGHQSATRTDLAADQNTAGAATKFYVGVGTLTDGDTPTSVPSVIGSIDELRVWRDSEEMIDETLRYTEWPWFGDERLVLYPRFNETTGAVTDSSKNGNDGTVLAGATQGATALVTALATIQALYHLRITTGREAWLEWSNGALYGQAVT
jgi:hypothetical protein